jgi:hypothetical protein
VTFKALFHAPGKSEAGMIGLYGAASDDSVRAFFKGIGNAEVKLSCLVTAGASGQQVITFDIHIDLVTERFGKIGKKFNGGRVLYIAATGKFAQIHIASLGLKYVPAAQRQVFYAEHYTNVDIITFIMQKCKVCRATCAALLAIQGHSCYLCTGGDMTKLVTGWLEKFSVGSMLIGFYQGNAYAVLLGAFSLIAAIYFTRRQL